MAKVIRQLTYEGSDELLIHWLERSLPDGASEMLPGLIVQTIYNDIDIAFGSERDQARYEGPIDG